MTYTQEALWYTDVFINNGSSLIRHFQLKYSRARLLQPCAQEMSNSIQLLQMGTHLYSFISLHYVNLCLLLSLLLRFCATHPSRCQANGAGGTFVHSFALFTRQVEFFWRQCGTSVCSSPVVFSVHTLLFHSPLMQSPHFLYQVPATTALDVLNST